MPRVYNGFTIASPKLSHCLFVFHRPQKEEKTRRRKTKKDEKIRKKIKKGKTGRKRTMRHQGGLISQQRSLILMESMKINN